MMLSSENVRLVVDGAQIGGVHSVEVHMIAGLSQITVSWLQIEPKTMTVSKSLGHLVSVDTQKEGEIDVTLFSIKKIS